MNKSCFRGVVSFIIIMVILILAGPRLIDTGMKFLYPKQYSEIVTENAQRFSLDENLIYAVIKAESKFDETAQSHAGAKGLMQLTDDTYQWILEHYPQEDNAMDIWDPKSNVYAGCALLRFLMDNYQGDSKLDVILSAYNAGMGNVSKWLSDYKYSKDGKTLDDIPYSETKKYIEKVKRNYNIYQNLYENK